MEAGSKFPVLLLFAPPCDPEKMEQNDLVIDGPGAMLNVLLTIAMPRIEIPTMLAYLAWNYLILMMQMKTGGDRKTGGRHQQKPQ